MILGGSNRQADPFQSADIALCGVGIRYLLFFDF